jgi:hypothetical protein
MLHLEANTCESGSDQESIRELVWEYYEINGRWNHDHDDGFDCYYCRAGFNQLSVLLQHVESENCHARISNYDSLFDHIEKSIYNS